MKRLASIAFCFLGACFNPDLSGITFTCDESMLCPPGYSCISGLCQQEGDTPRDLSGTPDGGGPGAEGCKSGVGFQVGTAWACPGPFNRTTTDSIPSASQLCSANFMLCTAATGIDLTACRQLSGFFAAPVNVKKQNQTYSCGTSAQMPGFAGCGGPRSTVVDLPAGQMCGGFAQAIDCAADNKWLCVTASLDTADQTNATDGVLCCKK